MEIFANFRDLKTDPYLQFIQQRYKDKPITFWYDRFPENLEQLSVNPYNFLFLHEPNEFFGLHIKRPLLTAPRFSLKSEQKCSLSVK